MAFQQPWAEWLTLLVEHEEPVEASTMAQTESQQAEVQIVRQIVIQNFPVSAFQHCSLAGQKTLKQMRAIPMQRLDVQLAYKDVQLLQLPIWLNNFDKENFKLSEAQFIFLKQ